MATPFLVEKEKQKRVMWEGWWVVLEMDKWMRFEESISMPNPKYEPTLDAVTRPNFALVQDL